MTFASPSPCASRTASPRLKRAIGRAGWQQRAYLPDALAQGPKRDAKAICWYLETCAACRGAVLGEHEVRLIANIDELIDVATELVGARLASAECQYPARPAEYWLRARFNSTLRKPVAGGRQPLATLKA